MDDVEHICFLLGAGFSVPAGYPPAKKINETLFRLREEDMSAYNNGVYRINDGNPGPNDRFTKVPEKRCYVRILEHYKTSCIQSSAAFNYESFYDWLEQLNETLVERPSQCPQQHHLFPVDCEKDDYPSLVREAISILQQLVRQMLHRHHPEVHLCGPHPQGYDGILEVFQRGAKRAVVDVHSLNHDLFFESLRHTDRLQGLVTDGFEELGSPYYGEVVVSDGEVQRSTYLVRLSRFTGRYLNKIRLYKLHGSVDQYVFPDSDDYPDSDRETIKLPWGVFSDRVRREVVKGDVHAYEMFDGGLVPRFLTGVESKQRRYSSTPYLQTMLDRFRANLRQSKHLVVIGYGFADEVINQTICQELRNGEKRMLVIDIRKPDTLSSMSCPCDYFEGGVVEFDKQAVLRQLLG
ncbi:MAG: SIR2 family protein [Bryobacteraceae bacterium]|nr:SIR2 family protein [Bryobacteraceae bacterium]